MSKKYFNHLFSAAKTALSHPRHAELMQWIGTGPSIRARARLAMMTAFLVATPTLFIGVLRTDDVVRYARTLNINDIFRIKVSELRLTIERVRTAIWRYEAQPEKENERLLLKEVVMLRENLSYIVVEKPKDFYSNSLSQLNELSVKLEASIINGLNGIRYSPEQLSKTSMTFAMLSLITLSNEVANIENEVRTVLVPYRQSVIDSLSRVGRDQLILFLILLFAIPIFVGLTPGWLVAPLMRLKSMEHRIEQGQIRDLAVSGRDEISDLARALQSALVWREELDQRKTAKIFEMRNVLRSVINHLVEPVFIIDRDDHINYANEAAAQLLDVEIHNLEGSGLQEHVFAPELEQEIVKARDGDVRKDGFEITFEMSSGRVKTLIAHVSAVHERQGGVSRIVLVLELIAEKTHDEIV
ncbi:MAG: PAS domain-containing protein [bacterium]|nr:PAS domain-containing protein [bacterium]